MLPVTKEYRGANRKEFLLLMRRLEAHFEEWNQFYVTDYLKISEAHRHLSDEIRLKWALVRVSPEGNKTWSDFCVWLSSNVRNFVHPDVAERRYRTARQRRYEPVARFARLLNSLEVNLPRLVSDDERCQRLWEGVLPEIRAASRQGYPTSFHAGLSDLCSVAKLIPGGGGDRYRPGRRRRRRGRRRFL
ncbi:hypothetical protein BJX61DRAFT_537334 [Aspergillus egyptiacus]|nr:hypothetical protein BJX61DRAFT_537334 [Aspergillus egyptiacus]